MVFALGYADDVDIIGRTFESMRDVFLDLQKESARTGVIINESKTKYLDVNPVGGGLRYDKAACLRESR